MKTTRQYKLVEGTDNLTVEGAVNELAKQGFKPIMMSTTGVTKEYMEPRFLRTILMEKVAVEEETPYRG